MKIQYDPHSKHKLMHDVILTHSLKLLQPLSELPNRTQLSMTLPLAQLTPRAYYKVCLKVNPKGYLTNFCLMKIQNQYQTC